MPRKHSLPTKELKILDRLRSCRRTLELPRRLFAKAAGLDSSVLIRLELERMPLRYGVARMLCNAHSINPQWLATGQGDLRIKLELPEANEIKANSDDLFSNVFSKSLAPIFASPNIDSFGDMFRRRLLAVFWSEIISDAFEQVKEGQLNALDDKLLTAFRKIIGPLRDDSAFHILRRQWLGKQYDRKELQALKWAFVPIGSQREESHLTLLTTSAKTDFVNHWHSLKAQILKAVGTPGGRSMLAKFLGVDLTQVSRWLSKTGPEPGADYALKMLQWVQERESKQ